ncbi:MAG: hypothetical protein KKA42_13200, partial [candidate division Zixibacteria bacterium]|nr:hypothetical protein [candidate division Zixibacteria bacterium]
MPGYAKLRADLVSSPSEIDGQTVYTVKDPVLGAYFRLREPEFWLVRQLDGETSPEDVARRFREKFNFNIDAAAVEQFIGVMDKLVFLDNSRSEQSLNRASYGSRKKDSTAGRFLFVKIRGFNPGRVLEFLSRLYRPFHTPFFFTLAAVAALFGLGVMAANASAFWVNLSDLWTLEWLATFIFCTFIMIAVHEFGHAIICRVYGGEVREMGFLLLYFQPCFYCDLSDAWLFRKKSHRLAVTLAGPYFQLMLLVASVILWRITTPGLLVNDVAWMLVTVNWINYVINFNPLIKLDGYYLLSDYLEIPNLRAKAFHYLGNLLRRRLLGWPVETVATTAKERRAFIAYGVLALVYSTALLGYMLTLIGRFLYDKMGPFGLLLLFAAVVVIIRRNIKNLIIGIGKHFRYMGRLSKQPVRLITYAILLIALAVVLLVVKFPQRVGGDITLRPIAEFSLALTDFGLLECRELHRGTNPGNQTSYLQMASTDLAALDLLLTVKEGDAVGVGDTIAMLTSNQIKREMEAARAELSQLEGQLALLQAPPKPEAVAEAQAQIDAALANLSQLRRDQNRTAEMVARELETKERLEAKNAEVEVAEAELVNRRSSLALLTAPPKPEEEAVLRRQMEKQEAQLAFLKEQTDAQVITAPFAGTANAGRKGQQILSVAATDLMEITV